MGNPIWYPGTEKLFGTQTPPGSLRNPRAPPHTGFFVFSWSSTLSGMQPIFFVSVFYVFFHVVGFCFLAFLSRGRCFCSCF
jgi:hypothetical protein